MGAATGMKRFRLSVSHPRRACAIELSVRGDATVADLVEALVEIGFLDDLGADQPKYWVQLRRTGRQLPLSNRLAPAGVQEGDSIVIALCELGD